MSDETEMTFDRWCLRAGALAVMAQTPEAAYLAIQKDRESGLEPPFRLMRWLAQYTGHGDLTLFLAQVVLAAECHRQEKRLCPDDISSIESL